VERRSPVAMVGRYAALVNASRSRSQWWPCRAAGRASASGRFARCATSATGQDPTLKNPPQSCHWHFS